MSRALALALVLAGCASPESGSDDWSRRVEAARALRPPIPAGDQAILDGLEARAKEAQLAISHPDDRASWEAAVPRIRKELRKSLGLDLLPPPQPRNLRSVGVVSRGEYRIEKLVYETLPGSEVPAHLYLPAHAQGKLPAILFVPGHWYADSKTRTEFQALMISMVLRGFAAITYDPFGQGERGISLRDHRRTELLAVGVAQEAIVAFESLCALEALLARPEVDPTRVGMTGASGGGFNSWILPALEPRIAVTIPVVGTSDFVEQMRAVRNPDWFTAKEHCHFIPGLMRYANNHELLACVAPRPVMVISAHNDIAFPIPGQRDVVKYGEALYAALDAKGKVGYFEDAKDGHGYQKLKREAAAGWFLKWLKGEGDGHPAPEQGFEIPAWDAPELRCFPPGENRPAGPGMNALAKSIMERLPRKERPISALIGYDPAWLPATPDLVVADPRLAIGSAPPPREGVSRVAWRAPDGVVVPAVLLRPPGTLKGALVVAGDGGKESMLDHPAVRMAYDAGWAVALTDIRGTGELSVTKPGWIYAVSLLLRENFVGRQAGDLVLGVRALRQEPWLAGKPIALLGSGRFASLAGLYAAMIERDVAWLAAEGGYDSFRDFVERPAASFNLARAGREREVVLDAEIPHAIVPVGALAGPDLPDLVKSLGPDRAAWGPTAALPFIRARLEEKR